MTPLLILGLYFALGILIAWLFDRAQMKKSPPYKDFLSAVPPARVRQTVFVLMVVFGPLLLCARTIKSLVLGLRHRLHRQFWFHWLRSYLKNGRPTP
jgi:hypothetical protein